MPVDWETYETEVVKLYVEEGKTAHDTIACLNQRHGINITLRQFKSNFGGLKKLGAEEWREVDRQIRERDEQGRASEVYVFGKRQDPTRIRRALRHSKNCKSSAGTKKDWNDELFGRQRVRIRTPPPQETLPSISERSRGSLNGLDTIETHPNPPWDYQFLQTNNNQTSNIDSDFDSIPNINDVTNLDDLMGANLLPTLDLAGSIDTNTSPKTITCVERSILPLNKHISISEFLPTVEPAELQVPPSVSSMALEGSGSFCPLWGSIESYTSFQNSFVPDAFEKFYHFPTFNWNQISIRVAPGHPGWLDSQLMGVGSNLNFDKPLIELLEHILIDKQPDHSLRLHGYTREAPFQLFDVIMHLVSNKLLSGRHLFNFINWTLGNNSSIPLNEFLRTKRSEMSNLAAEILSIISDEADWKNYDKSSQQGKLQHEYGEDCFIRQRPVEIVNLIRAADNRLLSSSLGGKLLVHTAQTNNLDAVKLLVERGADLNYVSTENFNSCFYEHIALGQERMTPLCGAVRGGSIPVLRYLIACGADINLTIKLPIAMGTKSALSEAVQKGRSDMVEILLRSGAKVPGSLMVGVSSIHKYARQTWPCISKLLEICYDPIFNFNTTESLLLLVEAAERGTNSLCDFLLQHEIFESEILEAALCHAIKMSNICAVRAFLHQSVDPNALQYRQSQYSDKLKHDKRASEVGREGIKPGSANSNVDAYKCYGDSQFLRDPDEDSDNDSGEDPEDYMQNHHPILLSAHGINHSCNSDILYLLIKAGATIPRKSLLSILRSSGYPTIDTFRAMIASEFHLDLVGPSALEQYAYKGKGIVEVGPLLDKGVDINAYGAYGKSALQAAAIGNETYGNYGGNLALVQFLLERGANANLPAKSDANPVWFRRWVGLGLTALQAAVMGGNGQIVDCLLEAGADVKAPPAKTRGYTALEAAAFALSESRYSRFQSSVEERFITFKKLITRGALMNLTDGSGGSVLHSLVRGSQTQCLKLALETGTNTEDRESLTTSQMTPFQVAAAYHNIDAMEILLSYHAEINALASDSFQGFTALQAALYDIVDENDEKIDRLPQVAEEAVIFLLRRDANVNAPAGNTYGRTALQAVTSQQQPNPRIVALLLEHGADVNAAPAKTGGVTALQGAATSGDLQIGRMLIDHGADVNAPPAARKGRTAIEAAAEHGRLDMVRMLLSAGVVPSSDEFSRAIRFAEKNQRFDISDLLRDRRLSYMRGFS